MKIIVKKRKREREKFNVAKQQHNKKVIKLGQNYIQLTRLRERFYYNYYICKENRRINCRLAKKQQQY